MPNIPPEFEPREQAFFLDFDGTLAPFRMDPSAVMLPSGGNELLARFVEACGGAVAVVSGRRIEDLDRMMAPLKPVAGGLHGVEMRVAADAAIERRPPSPSIAEARARLIASLADTPDIRLEDKGAALVLHFRGNEHLEELARDIANGAVAGLDGLIVVPGHAIFEIRMAGVDKGAIVDMFMARPPFVGRHPVFLGDDTTDEDGFAGAARHGGYGIKVGSGDTIARYRLPDIAAVWGRLAAALGEDLNIDRGEMS